MTFLPKLLLFLIIYANISHCMSHMRLLWSLPAEHRAWVLLRLSVVSAGLGWLAHKGVKAARRTLQEQNVQGAIGQQADIYLQGQAYGPSMKARATEISERHITGQIPIIRRTGFFLSVGRNIFLLGAVGLAASAAWEVRKLQSLPAQ